MSPRATSATGVRRADQLPAGRHGLSREVVTGHQRERILRAILDVTSVAGYARCSVEDVIATAGVSRRTFYDLYPNKQAAFLAAYDDAVAALERAMLAAFSTGDGIVERTVRALETLAERLAGDPAMTEACVVEALAAGSEAVARRDATMRQLARLIDRGVTLSLGRAPSPLTAEAIAGGIHEIVYARAVRGELAQLRAAVPDLVYAIFLPYAGSERADAARAMAQAART